VTGPSIQDPKIPERNPIDDLHTIALGDVGEVDAFIVSWTVERTARGD
jgi:hypothetical protein